QDERTDTPRCGAGKSKRGARALRHSNQRDPVESELIAQRAQVLAVLLWGRNAVGKTMAAAIETYEAEAVTQCAHLWIPHLEIQRPAVHQQHRWPATLVAVAQARAVHDQKPICSWCWRCRH